MEPKFHVTLFLKFQLKFCVNFRAKFHEISREN